MWVLAGTGWLGCDSRTDTAHPRRWGSHADSRQGLWSVQPYSSIPCWAQARAYTPGAQGRRTAAPGHTCTASSHTGPRKARGPPGGGSGRTPRRSSEAGTAPTGPAGGRGHLSEGAAHAAWHPLTLVLGDPPCPETQACSLTPSRCLSTSVKRNSPVSGTLSDPCLMGQPETRATS